MNVVDSTYTIANNVEQFNQQFAAKLEQGYDLIDLEYGDGTWVGVFNGVVANTETTNNNSTPTPNEVINDGLVQDVLLDNTHFAFDPDNYF